MLRNNGNRGAVKLRGGWVIGGEWTQSLAEIQSWRRGGQVVADYKYKEQVVAEKSKFIRTST